MKWSVMGAVSTVLRQASSESDLPGVHLCAHRWEEGTAYNFLNKTASRVQCSYTTQSAAFSPPFAAKRRQPNSCVVKELICCEKGVRGRALAAGARGQELPVAARMGSGVACLSAELGCFWGDHELCGFQLFLLWRKHWLSSLSSLPSGETELFLLLLLCFSQEHQRASDIIITQRKLKMAKAG